MCTQRKLHGSVLATVFENNLYITVLKLNILILLIADMCKECVSFKIYLFVYLIGGATDMSFLDCITNLDDVTLKVS